MSAYIHQHLGWPNFNWDNSRLVVPLSHVRHTQGRLLGKLEGLGFQLKEKATLETVTQDVVKSSEIEGEHLPMDQVRSSVARKLGIEIAGVPVVNRHVEGIVQVMLDASQEYNQPLSKDRLIGWHSALFPTGRSGLHKIVVGEWRDDSTGPMQVVSGALGKERVHFEAPEAARLEQEMQAFINWFNTRQALDPVLKSAIAHLWFVTIHPFDDGNGRIARAIADMQLARADQSKYRFYSMSAQIQKERNVYYTMLEKTQRGNLDITEWLLWYLDCLDRALALSSETLSGVIQKAKFWETNQAIALNERQRTMLNKLMDHFEGKLTTSKWAKMAKCSPDTALRDIQDLIDKKVLAKEAGGGRSTSYRLVDRLSS
ncbi:MAG TPA: Fic family protein [Chryseosolibacter sp.]